MNQTNGMQFSWPNNFSHLVQYYEVMLDNEVYAEVKDTRVAIHNWYNTSHIVTVTPVDHCSMRGISASFIIYETTTQPILKPCKYSNNKPFHIYKNNVLH